MRRPPTALLLALLTTAACAQTAPTPPASTITASTQLVVVDVVVSDKRGNPVHGLTREDFQLADDHHPQALRTFEEHTPPAPNGSRAALPKMPPGIFTDYTPFAAGSALNILLVDSLNTPTTDQPYLRDQLKQYLHNATPGARIAIFGLNTRIVLLQGFTANPELLRDAIAHKLLPRTSPLLDDPNTVQTEGLADSMADFGGQAAVSANVAEFEARTAADQTQLRIQRTLDAFNTLAHYLASLPGRKNLIWFSGAFPINIMPDGALADPFTTVHVNQDEFRETTALLSRAEVAVYPVDARGLITPPALSANNSGSKYTRGDPTVLSKDLSTFSQSQADEHSTMDSLAQDTGGHAYYNTNGLAEAVASAIQAGSSYYTLTYSPAPLAPNGKYHSIHVSLNGAASNATLAYRRGYFADLPARSSASPTAPPAAAATQPATSLAYLHAAMDRGAPAPQDILFKVRVLPASTVMEPAVAPGNQLDPRFPVKGPFQRYAVDFVSLAHELHLDTQPDGSRTGKIQYLAFLYDSGGRLLNSAVRTINVRVPADRLQEFLRAPLEIHLEISAPARRETFLRLGLYEPGSNHIGVVEVATQAVSSLPPATTQTPASAPSTPSTAAPPPATAHSAPR